jgi:hypothetical protein
MLKEFFCKNCLQTKTQDMQSKSKHCCTACEKYAIRNVAKSAIKETRFISRVAAHTVAHKKMMNDLEYNRELAVIEQDNWMEL